MRLLVLRTSAMGDVALFFWLSAVLEHGGSRRNISYVFRLKSSHAGHAVSMVKARAGGGIMDV